MSEWRHSKLISRFLKSAMLFACLAGNHTNAESRTGQGQASSSDAHRAALAVETLQKWYVPTTGLYQKPTDWWNTANAITVLVDYSRVAHTTKYLRAVANTFAKANGSYGIKNFLNDSNDDEGWWAMAWIDAYDLTRKPAYLSMAETIFSDMATQWDTTVCGGGVWWSKDLKNSAYKNAITNELFLEIAASLANREQDAQKRDQYLSWATKEWMWFKGSGMINSQNFVNDGLNAQNPAACTNNKQTTWTYNQGVLLGGLAELSKAESDPSLLPQAQSIADAAMSRLVTTGGILKEPSGDGPDLPQFKGIFLRNLARLNRVAPNPRNATFARANADSIWKNDQGPGHQLGIHWEGPFDSGDGTRQTSALDALIAAIEMEQP